MEKIKKNPFFCGSQKLSKKNQTIKMDKNKKIHFGYR